MVLVLGVLALLIAIGVVLAQSAPRRSGTNGIPSETFAAVVRAGETVCQSSELVPADTAALRLTIGTYGRPGPALSLVAATSAGGPITQGGLTPGWRQGVISIPVRLVARTIPNARVCLHNAGPGKLAIGGAAPYAPALELIHAGRTTTAAAGLRVDYIRPGKESWFSLLPTLWYRMTLAKGDVVRHWAPWGALVLVLIAAGAAIGALVRPDNGTAPHRADLPGDETAGADPGSSAPVGRRSLPGLRRLPVAAWLCVLVALANGVAWSLITPPFEVPDENAHYAYVNQLASRGTLPHTIRDEGHLSPAEDAMLAASGYYRVVGIRGDPSPFTAVQQDEIDAVARANLSTAGTGDALVATASPPLYYLIQTVPFALAPGGTVLNRLAFMRVVSALLGGLTVLFVFMLLRELLPGTPGAWTAGALAVAFQPLFGFMSGGVSYDDLMYACSTGLLLAIVRAFRRGLTGRAAVEIGLALGLGLVGKVAMDGLVPAAALGLLILLVRAYRPGVAPPGGRSAALWASAATVLVAAIPVAAYLAWNRTSAGRAGLTPQLSSAAGVPGLTYNLRAELSRVWQLFLPHLWLRPQFSYLPLWQTWFRGTFGVFGWLDYSFSAAFFHAALKVVLAVCALAVVGLVRARGGVRRHLGELAVFVVALGGICGEIGIVSYRTFLQSGGQFEQARYLLPLLGTYALIVALATRAAGPRWVAAIGALLVMVALSHNLFAQMLTIERYYS